MSPLWQALQQGSAGQAVLLIALPGPCVLGASGTRADAEGTGMTREQALELRRIIQQNPVWREICEQWLRN